MTGQDHRVGVAIVGAAHTPHALSYARALAASPDAELIGVWDDDADVASRVAQFGEAPAAADAEALVADRRVQAVVICGATVDHARVTALAAGHGRHVLCEKPIATTMRDADSMIDACHDAGVQLHIAFVTRFYPIVQQLRVRIGAGELGDLVGMVGANRGRPPLPPTYPTWITTPDASGGGALIDHSVHVTDVMRHVSGREVISVDAEVDNGLWNTSVDDTALMLLAFEGGVAASVDPSWSVPENAPIDYDFSLHVVGTGGSITITDTAEAIDLVAPGLRPGAISVPFGLDIDAAMVACFLRSIREGNVVAPAATGDDGRRALEIALAGYEAASSGRRVELPLRASS